MCSAQIEHNGKDSWNLKYNAHIELSSFFVLQVLDLSVWNTEILYIVCIAICSSDFKWGSH